MDKQVASFPKKVYEDAITKLEDILKMPHHIPKYQRNYDWDLEQCQALFDDLVRYSDHKTDCNSKYIFGQIVSYNSDRNRLYILDGQQRLTTASLLIAAVRSIIKKLVGLHPGKDIFQEKNIAIKGLLIKDDEPLLNVYKTNEELYWKIICDEDIFCYYLKDQSQINLKQNYEFFYDRLCEKMNIKKDEYGVYADSSFIDNVETYKLILKYYEDFINFRVCSIYSHHLSESYEMFETINNRGIPLTPFDLLKNHIYSKCYTDDETLDEDKDRIEDKWAKIMDLLEGLKGDKEKYLRYYINATLEFVRTEKMYEVLIRSIYDREDSLKFIENFTNSLEFFKLAFSVKYSTDEISVATKRILRGFTENKFESYSPLALSVYLRNKNDKKLNDRLNAVLRAYDHFYVLNLIPQLSKTGKIEKKTSDLAIEYYKGGNISEIVRKVYDVNDHHKDVICEKLSQLNWSSGSSRYVLSELYNRANGTNVVNLDTTHLEHILPESNPANLSKFWPNITPDEHLRSCQKIGNLVLLNEKTNKSIQDKEFQHKKTWYLKDDDGNPIKRYSDINDQYFIGQEEWNGETISRRTEFLVQTITKQWARQEYHESK